MRIWGRASAKERARRRLLRKAYRRRMRDLRRTDPEQWREAP